MSEKLLVDNPAVGVRRITLNRPEALNAFDFAMYDELRALLAEIQEDLSVRVVIITGAGRGFCAGHDVRVGGEPAGVDPSLGRLQRGKIAFGRLTPIPMMLRHLPQPVIAVVNGVAAGIGFALAISCDLVLVGESGKFVNAIHNAATGAELGMSWLLPRMVGLQKAAEILYTARPIGADEAERVGLALKAVPDESLMEEALILAADIAVNVPLGIWLTKQSLWQGLASGFETTIELEARGTQLAQSTEDAAEKRTAVGAKRAPSFSNR